MELLGILSRQVLILDGGMGTEIYRRSGKSLEAPEIWNIDDQSHIIRDIHRSYIDAGADIIETNTLGANRIKLENLGLANRTDEINQGATRLAREARGERRDVLIAGSMGPTGKLLQPLGDLGVDDAFVAFAEQARALEKSGVDFLLIETQIDIHEAKTALRAAKDVTSLPVAVSMTFPQDGDRTVTGSDPEAAAVVFSTPDTDLYGINCGGHPEKIVRILEKTLKHNSKPLLVYANAGEPRRQGETTVFPLDPLSFLPYARKFYDLGAGIIGGCCGTTPEHIRFIAREFKGKKPGSKQALSAGFRAAGRTVTIHLGGTKPFRIIGENINPFARKALAVELEEGRMDLARSYARRQGQAGAHALDINLGKRAEKEPDFYAAGIAELQNVSNLPFFLDNRSPASIEAALKKYAGKAVINSVSAEKTSRTMLLPLAKKYGAGVILLAMGDNGIPDTAKARFDLLKRLHDEALDCGLNPEDLLVDPVVMSLASSPEKVFVTLDTIELISSFHIPTILGLSNISFGLPERRLLNSSFLCMARQRGLASAILDPLDKRLVSVICAGDALTGKDSGLKNYLAVFAATPEESQEEEETQPADAAEALFNAILEGEKARVRPLVENLLAQGRDGFAILNEILSPALEKAGEFYERNVYFLPQLILAAEAMEAATSVLEGTYEVEERAGRRARIVLATVKGDLHDIGKNIVHLVLRNSGFEVLDLGKNVSAQDILEAAHRENADAIGLSSLMTTTLDEMQRTVRLRDRHAPDVPVIVGGAAVSPSFAKEIGADAYGKDALDAVRRIKELLKERS